MALEIEHKYLVKNDSFKVMATKKIDICQGYLCHNPEHTIRVRTWNDKSFLTIKGITHGAIRHEFEYEIPHEDAIQLLRMCTTVLHKTRYIVPFKEHIWEIDEFHDTLAPLVTAEIELNNEDEQYERPQFIGKDVTGDPRYYNSVLSQGK